MKPSKELAEKSKWVMNSWPVKCKGISESFVKKGKQQQGTQDTCRLFAKS